jgi:hypothetical protein
MHTGIISFADRIVHNIKTNDIKDLILEQLYSLYGIKIIQKQHHRLDENNIKYIIKNPHMCNLRSNGNPYMMFLTRHNDTPIIYFVDKKIHPGYQKPRILLVRGMFSESLYDNTLIDGEMVKCNDGKWIFLFNDIIAYEGKHLVNSMLQDRLKILYNILDNQHTKDPVVDVCKYMVKTYYYPCKEGIADMIKISNELNYTCRGIYFWSSDLKYKNKLYNFNEENIKSVVRKVKDETEFQMKDIVSDAKLVNDTKSTNISRVDQPVLPISCGESGESERMLWMSQTDYPDVYNIYDGENTLTSNKLGISLIPNLSISKMIRQAFKNTNAATVIHVRCLYNSQYKKWYPVEIK